MQDKLGDAPKHKKNDILVSKQSQEFAPNNKLVISQFFMPGWSRVKNVVTKVLKKSPQQKKVLLENTINTFQSRHRNLLALFLEHYHHIETYCKIHEEIDLNNISEQEKLLIGAYFTSEYALASSAYCNPSLVKHTNQTGLSKGSARVIISFRAIGEGHISSIVFRTGIITKNNHLILEEPSTCYAEKPIVTPIKTIWKEDIIQKITAILPEFSDSLAETVLETQLLNTLPNPFEFSAIQSLLILLEDHPTLHRHIKKTIIQTIKSFKNANYDLRFNPQSELNERIIFPVSEFEAKGIEDARFVEFNEAGKKQTFFATYTAYDGQNILSKLIQTDNFINFKIRSMSGNNAKNKGMALFPEKIDGKYAMISRQDGVGLYITFSKNLKFWDEVHMIRMPEEDWELIQIGNCGSPIKTEAGWLLLTHGVGAMRRYSIGIMLLDLKDPKKIIGNLRKPLIVPDESERNGYVPNVVYSCGGLIHNKHLIIPYAYADYATKIATMPLEWIINKLK